MLKLAATLRIELLHVKPLVWRRFVVPADIQLPKLHKVIHSVMGWEDTHLHEFDLNGERFGVQDKDVSDEGLRSEKGVRLNHALGSATEFEYRYDFGDDWQHRVIVESVGYPDLALALPVCLAGENACPPEDVGGPHGYAEFLAALRDKTHEQHNDFRSWVGGVFDPVGFDVKAVNAKPPSIVRRILAEGCQRSGYFACSRPEGSPRRAVSALAKPVHVKSEAGTIFGGEQR